MASSKRRARAAAGGGQQGVVGTRARSLQSLHGAVNVRNRRLVQAQRQAGRAVADRAPMRCHNPSRSRRRRGARRGRFRFRHAPPGDSRYRRRSPADGDPGWAPCDRLQRRDLQPSRGAPAAYRGWPQLSRSQRYRNDPRRFRRLGRRGLAVARRYVRGRDLGSRDTHADAGARPARDQAALCLAAGGRPVVRLGAQIIAVVARSSLRHRRPRGRRRLQLRSRPASADDLPSSLHARSRHSPHDRPDGRSARGDILAAAVRRIRTPFARRLGGAHAHDAARYHRPAHAVGRAGRCVPVGRDRFFGGAGGDDARGTGARHGFHHRLSGRKGRRDGGGARGCRASRLPACRAAARQHRRERYPARHPGELR